MSVLTNRKGPSSFIISTIPETQKVLETMKKITKEEFPRFSSVTSRTFCNGKEIWVSVDYPADTMDEINKQIEKFQRVIDKWKELTGLTERKGYFVEHTYILRGILAADFYYSELLTDKERKKLEAAKQ